MCTRVLWTPAAGSVFVGRNMDFFRDLRTNLWAFPRGMTRDNGVDGSLHWTSKYGSLVASAEELTVVDGINEAGLAGHKLVLAESDYGARDPARPALSMAIWLQYVLDSFATVAEAVAWTERSRVQIIAQDDPLSGLPLGLHLALEDATGDSAIIEYLDGSATIHHGSQFTVLTNSPPYDEQLALQERRARAADDQALPGGTESHERFARAAYYLRRLPEPRAVSEAVASLLSVMRNAGQPFRIPDPDRPEASQTLWRTVIDVSRRILVFESTTRPNILWVKLDALALETGAPVQRLDLVADTELEGGLVGNVNSAFVPSVPLSFLPARTAPARATAAHAQPPVA